MNEATMTEPAMNGAPTPQEDYAVQLTDEEWHEQAKLDEEYVDAIVQRDRKKADEILPKLIWPAWMLKCMKKSMGANYIRKNGYNTIDADLVYGPGWLDEDDGGPTSTYSEDYKPQEVSYESIIQNLR